MFDFLNKPTHEGHKAIPEQLILSRDNSSINNNKIQQQSEVVKLQKGTTASLDPKVMQLLQQILVDSKLLNRNATVDNLILNEQQKVEDNVYVRETATDQNEYLHDLLEKVEFTNKYVRKGLKNIIGGTIDDIMLNIENNQPGFQIFKKGLKSKDDLIELEALNKIRMIKIKEGQIAQKVGQLRMQFNVQDVQVNKKARDIIQRDNYSKDNEKTKQAERYVEQKRLQREEHERKVRQARIEKENKKIEKKLQQQLRQNKTKSERHAKLVEKFQEKQLQKQRRKAQMQTQKQKFENFLKQYKKRKPLYVQKIQEQQKRQIQLKKQRYATMAKRKNNYSSMSLSEIEDFENKYLEMKKLKQQQRKMELKMMKREEMARGIQGNDKNYKGKYRYLMLEQMLEKQEKQAEKQYQKKLLQEKKKSYSVDVKQNFKPKIDIAKKMERQLFIFNSKKKKLKGPVRLTIDYSNPSNLNTISYKQQPCEEPDPKKQGLKNLRHVRHYIYEKMQRGQIKTSRRANMGSSEVSFTPRIDYLKQQRQKRQTQQSSFDILSQDSDSRIFRPKIKIGNDDVSLIKLKAQQLDEKMKRKQQKFRYAEHSVYDEKQLEEDYVTSIKAKLKVLQNCK